MLARALRFLACTVALAAATVRAESPPPFLAMWGTFGTGPGEFQKTADVACGASGIIYVADYVNARIQRFTASGVFLDAWPTQPIDNATVLPRSIAVDASENVFVVDQGGSHVQKYTSTGSLITTWGEFGPAPGQLRYPDGIAVGPDGHVFVANGVSGDPRIQEFTSAGTYVRTVLGFPLPGPFALHGGIAVDGAGNIFVSDVVLYQVTKLDSDGNVLTRWGAQGAGDGFFDAPGDVACDQAGDVYVLDQVFPPFQPSNHRVQKFTNSGDFLSGWGGFGASPGQFDDPHGVAVDASNNVYVADTNNNRVQKFGDATVAVAISDFEVSRSPTGIELRWRFEPHTGVTFAIWRSDAAEAPFVPVTEIAVRGGEARFVDSSVRPEADYWYELGIRQDGRLSFTTPLRAGAAPAQSWLAAGPNPSQGPVRIEFSVARPGPARLEVFDVAGGRVRTLSDRRAFAGLTASSWDGLDDRGTRVPAGRYFIRLSTGGPVRTQSVVLLR